jgi:hypothetical protein
MDALARVRREENSRPIETVSIDRPREVLG